MALVENSRPNEVNIVCQEEGNRDRSGWVWGDGPVGWYGEGNQLATSIWRANDFRYRRLVMTGYSEGWVDVKGM